MARTHALGSLAWRLALAALFAAAGCGARGIGDSLDEPIADEPSADSRNAGGAPADESPATELPATDAPADEHPATELPADVPPAGESPESDLSALIPGSTCYELRNHGATEQEPHLVTPGEQIHCLHFEAPWPDQSVLVAWETETDAEALHEWRLFTDGRSSSHDCLGTQIGVEGAELVLAGFRGAGPVAMPEGRGLALPGAGVPLELQWQFVNESGRAVADASVARLCILRSDQVDVVAGLTVLGVEDLNGTEGFGPGRHRFSGTCTLDPSTRRGIVVLMVAPHMHRLGRRVELDLHRRDTTVVGLLDYRFDYERHEMIELSQFVEVGESLSTHCTFDNDGGGSIAYGPSIFFEQCYVLAITDPAGMLDNGVPNLLGVENTCW